MIFNTNIFNIRLSLSLSFGFRPLFLLADDVVPSFVYAVITVETTALDTPNKVAVLFTDAAGRRAPINRPL